MSTGSLPSFIEPFKWADRGAQVDARVPLKPFDRLLQGALSDDGVVTVRCGFLRDPQGVAWLEGEVSTSVTLTCQRCLEAVAVPLAADVRLALLSDEADADRLAADADYVVVDEAQFSLQEALEDELILALPLAPSHESCEAAWQGDAPEPVVDSKQPNPFLVLASLRDQEKDS